MLKYLYLAHIWYNSAYDMSKYVSYPYSLFIYFFFSRKNIEYSFEKASLFLNMFGYG